MSQVSKHTTASLGRWMVVVAWLLILALLSYFFHHWSEKKNNPNQQITTSFTGSGAKKITILRNSANQYIASGKINGEPVTFLLDTGASAVIVPEKLVERLKLKRGRKLRAVTANGTINVYHTEIKTLSLGEIRLTNVKASINPYSHNAQVLLGMSVLKQLDFSQRGRELTLIQHQ